MSPGDIGKVLIVVGGIVVAAGLLLVLLGRFPGVPLGRLPGDIRVHRDGFTLYFPLATSVLLSILLSLVLLVVGRLFRS